METLDRKDYLENLNQRLESLNETLSLLSVDFINGFSELSKKQMERVALTVIEYPVPSEKKAFSENEANLMNLGIKLKETQMALVIINNAIKELEMEENNG
jgi:hypothetical protein